MATQQRCEYGIVHLGFVSGPPWLFGLNRFEPLTYPIGGLVTLLSMLLFKNYVEQIHYLIRVQPIFVPVLVLGVYALLYAGFSIRKLVLPKQGNLEAPMILEAGPDEIE